MKKLIMALMVFVCASMLSGCFVQTVPAGNVGVQVDLYGSDKGVQNKVVGIGRHWVGFGQELYTFPTFNQLKTYSEPFSFQTSDSMSIIANVGIEYAVDPTKVTTIFQTYRKGLEDITETNIRQNLSDALINRGSTMNIDALAAGGKAVLLNQATADLRAHLEPIGIRVIKLSWTKDLEYPKQVTESINAKIKATQNAQLRENEVAQSRAEAQKDVEKAKGEAQSVMLKAKAEADAINIKGQALKDNPLILQLEAIKQWNGVPPTYVSGNGGATIAPYIQFKQ